MEKISFAKIPLNRLLGVYEHSSGKVWSVVPVIDQKFQISYGRKNLPPTETRIVDAKEALRRTLSKINGGFIRIDNIADFSKLDWANICFDDLSAGNKATGLLAWLRK